MNTLNLFTLFRAVIIQSKSEDSFHLAYDWIKSTRKNENNLKGHTFGLLAVKDM